MTVATIRERMSSASSSIWLTYKPNSPSISTAFEGARETYRGAEDEEVLIRVTAMSMYPRLTRGGYHTARMPRCVLLTLPYTEGKETTSVSAQRAWR